MNNTINFRHGEPIEFWDSRAKKWIPATFYCIHSFPNIFLIKTNRLTVAANWLTRKV